MIKFNQASITDVELNNIKQVIKEKHFSGDGIFTKKCHKFFEEKYGFKKALLTTSGTAALEMAAILVDIQPGDEVIVPAFTFVTTANAFVLRGAKIVFCDVRSDYPNIDESKIEKLITDRTKAIVPVHYAGVACEMDTIMEIANKHNLFVVEDAAQAVDSYYKGKALGSIGHFGCFSFHETKNITSGEGGMLTINDSRFIERAEIIREKGTDRSKFFRGQVDKYGWVDIGSSYLPSDILAAILWGQIERLNQIQSKRIEIWDRYYEGLKELEDRGKIKLAKIPSYATNNAHMFFIVCKSIEERTELMDFLKESDIHTVFHYLSLDKSKYSKENFPEQVKCENSYYFEDCLLRLPMFYGLKESDQQYIVKMIGRFYG
jgi:dTDP-4-amino-4,6-dideoxygalactose transaminase